ncbi:borealin Nbl1 [Schizosaccharomyces japonicus yFS275]|uniref:Borealin Nbl1 n=1 Tax=Schizosaccharomyces japonicus (strain yFS275 / FY16936) TaxID=402676 RepID=B6JWC3_SCHJY|nr:borealin Nbl1 [Schizosaccharomyces japonicus yFS275]EEB05674.1 borealin Nbl1 [Schizosaccharomyces japonicus yFS275]
MTASQSVLQKRKRVDEPADVKQRQVRQKILREKKSDILANLAFELSDKIRRLRSNASLLASTIKMRGEIRIASIPRAQRSVKLRDLIKKEPSSIPRVTTPWRSRIKDFYKLDEISPTKREPSKLKFEVKKASK